MLKILHKDYKDKVTQGVLELYMNIYNCNEKEATPMMIVTLVFVACFLQ